MPESALFDMLLQLPGLDSLRPLFMRQAMLGLLLIAPMTAVLGVQVTNFRMAFFADAISHSAFAGVALGLVFALNPHWTMPLFGMLVGVLIMLLQRNSSLSTDTVIGVVFAGVMAFGLAVVSRHAEVARDMQRFLYGDILTIDAAGLRNLGLLSIVVLTFQITGFNRLLYIGMHAGVARAHRIPVALFQYAFVMLLALVVMLSIWAVGVFLVTALLIVPAAAARNLARKAGSMFWWALIVGTSSAVAGLLISAQDWANTATGPTVVLCNCGWFAVSQAVAVLRKKNRSQG